ncbi:MAG: insulinase family protein [Dysgonamonadaceae bacterium]|jgi:zinc protease|nr:insulinase family protein [Dysgonamonadaceae bacterium]
MKKNIFVLGLILVSFMTLSAQQQLQPLPLDPKVKYGKLDNGLTYYIRNNELPKDRVEFFIAQNVGAILEEDNQNGLAHFLEHMAFNGLTHFPGKTMSNYLETIGVRFGANLNASTGQDQTMYLITDVPTTRESIIDTCLLILHDWSCGISLQEDEIDKERGVIREEMRSYGGAGFRIREQIYPQILPGNQYAKRNIIGTEEVIMNFKPQEIRDFYHKWYRPDLQALVIVGDIDADKIEAKIKTLFADIPKPVNPAERIDYPVADNVEPLVGIATDKEATGTSVSIYFKHEILPQDVKASIAGLIMSYINSTVSQMLNARFSEMVQKANPPFIGASGYYGSFYGTRSKDAFNVGASVKENNVENAMKAISTEIERVNKYGFTASEYDRARTNILKSYENSFKEKDKTRNANYAYSYINHFIRGGSVPGIEYTYNMMNNVAPTIPVEAINEYIKEAIGDENIVITYTAPEKEGVVVPAKEQLLAWFNDARKEDIKPYEDKVSNEPLMKDLPVGGAIKSETKDPRFGTTNLLLSNGVKVIIKQTDFKDDEILLSATSPGGSSLFPESEMENVKAYNDVANLGGISSFSVTDLQKLLAGKRASARTSVSLTSEGMNGYSSVKDFETMLQLAYLNFTSPRMDQDAFESFKSRYKSMLESQLASPNIALMDTMASVAYKNPERNARFKAEDLDKVDYQKIMDWRKDRFKDAGDFTFIFVGNINPDSAKTQIAQYLGALPSINRKETFAEVKTGYKEGLIKNDFNKEMKDPKTTVIDIYSGKLDSDMPARIKMDFLQKILTLIYTEKVREDEGGTYGVGVSGGIAHYPKGDATVFISFETNAEKKDFLNGIILREFQDLADNGPKAADFQKTKEALLKNYQQNLKENNYWNSIMINFYREGYDGYTDYEKTVNAITPADVKTLAKQFLEQKNLIQVIMTGVK